MTDWRLTATRTLDIFVALNKFYCKDCTLDCTDKQHWKCMQSHLKLAQEINKYIRDHGKDEKVIIKET